MSNFKEEVMEMRSQLAKKYGPDEVGEKPLISIISPNLNNLYFDTIINELKHGRINHVDFGSFDGSYRLEFDKASLCVLHPTARPLAPIPREGITVTTNDDNIEDYFQNYILDGSLKPNEHYKYSSWIVGIPQDQPLMSKGIPRGTHENQLENCVKHFVEKGYSNNHCAIPIGGPESLKRYWWKYENETEKGSSECLRQIMMYIKDNKLDMHTSWRSWDLFAGLPENLGGMTRLLEYTTEWINAIKKPEQSEVKPGKLYAESPGLHIYSHNLDIAKIWANID